MKPWLTYAAAGGGVTLLGAAAGSLLVPAGAVGAVWFAAGLAYALQLVAFGALVAVHGRNELFLVGWLAGLVLRFATLGAVAVWLARTPVFPRAPALLSLVAFVFVLLLLEPLFLRRDVLTR